MTKPSPPVSLTGNSGTESFVFPRRIPNDYSRCPGTRCDVRHLCARHTAECRAPVSLIDFSALGPAVDRVELCGNHIGNQYPRQGDM